MPKTHDQLTIDANDRFHRLLAEFQRWERTHYPLPGMEDHHAMAWRSRWAAVTEANETVIRRIHRYGTPPGLGL